MEAKTAFSAADILLPKKEHMSESWSVCACDQYTGEPDYWAETEQNVGSKPSTLRLILPELYLEDADVADRIARIRETMNSYLEQGIFEEHKNAMVYVERIQSDGKLRAGLVGKIDLEQYDYSKGSISPVRATEATVAERIPPRLRIRSGAALELPHIMILLDDTKQTVIEPLAAKKASMAKLYDTPLMQGGGSICGWLIPEEEQAKILSALEGLAAQSPEEHPLVYAMGDGNHSLATAKAYYEAWKKEHPGENTANAAARYALVELVNLHSPALEFEAIHRILTQIDAEKMLADMTAALELTPSEDGEQVFTVIMNGTTQKYAVHKPTSNLTVGSVQMFLDAWLKDNGGKIDYIHGADVVEKLASEPDTMGILLPDMQKSELFPTVIQDGALPRKTFSMGHAADKRFYMECRSIL
ncbi:MAG: DUF1015 domain-containing protein [Oscillospiraceae bacterium]|nr:DUF1015 domain-containing protein [Oscillospiraceae bacterium]